VLSSEWNVRRLRSDQQTAATLRMEMRIADGVAQDQRQALVAFLEQMRADLRPDPVTAQSGAELSDDAARLRPLANLIDEVEAAPTEVARLQGQRESTLAEMAKVPEEGRRDVDVAEAEWRLAGVECGETQSALRRKKTELGGSTRAADKARGLEAEMLVARGCQATREPPRRAAAPGKARGGRAHRHHRCGKPRT